MMQSIKSRLWAIAIAGPIFIVAISLLWWTALNTLKVNGPIYGQIMQVQDLEADVMPPPLYILESYLVVLQAQNAEPAKLDGLKQRFSALQANYERRYQHWVGAGLDPEIGTLLLDKSHPLVMRFYDAANAAFFPALLRGDRTAADEVLKEIADLYSQHRAVIDELVAATLRWETATEKATAASEESYKTQSIGLSVLASMLALIGIAIISRSITRPLGRLTNAMKEVTEGNSDVAIPDTGNKGEIGLLARGLEELRKAVADAFRLNRLVEEQPAAVVLCTPDLKISYLNKSALNIARKMKAECAQQDRAQVVGRSILEFHSNPEEIRRAVSDIKTLPYGDKFTLEGVTIENGIDAVMDRQGKVVGCMVSWKDVTDYIKLSETFEREVKNATQSVANACAQLSEAAQSMTAAASETKEESSSVAAASEQATQATADLDAKERATLSEALGMNTKGAKPRHAQAALRELEDQQKARAKRLQRDALDRVLTELTGYYRDVFALQTKATQRLINADLAVDLTTVAKRTHPEQTIASLDAILACREALETNVAPQLAMESLMISLHAA